MTKYVSAVALAQGDVVCLDPSNPGQVTLATAPNLAAFPAALGVATAAATAGSVADIADSGSVASAITGLGVGNTSLVGVSANRCVRIVTPGQNDYVVGVVDTAGTLTIQAYNAVQTLEARFLNVRDYGAAGDGTTDDIYAFRAAIAAMGPPAQQGGPGNTLSIPPGTYVLSDDLHVTRHLILVGAHSEQTVLQFAAGKGVIIDYNAYTGTTGPDGGGGYKSIIRNVHIKCTKLTLSNWTPSAAYSTGARVRDPSEHRWHYECVVAGTSAPTFSSRPYTRYLASSALGFPAWAKHAARTVGESIVSTSYPYVWFECTAAGISAASEPSWAATVGATTTDGTATWTCRAISFVWKANAVHAVGDLVYPTGSPTNAIVFECTATVGTAKSGATEPSSWNFSVGGTTTDNEVTWTARSLWPTTVDTTIPWAPSTAFFIGQLIAPAAGLGATPPVYFECTTAGTSGATSPTWSTAPASTTIDGGAVWKAVVGASSPPASADIWLQDGSVLWAGRSASGLWMRAISSLIDVRIGNATNAAVLVSADVTRTPPTNANVWTIERAHLYGSGVGLAILGGDTNVGLASQLILDGSTGWGLWDSSFLGCTFIACEANANGAAYNCDSPTARSFYVGCYAESDQRPSSLTPAGTVWLGTAGTFQSAPYGKVAQSLRFSGGVFAPQLKTVNSIGTDVVTTTIGTGEIDKVALTFASSTEDAGGRPWRLHHAYLKPNWWELVWAASSSVQSLKIADAASTGAKPGSLWSYQPRTYFGSNGNSIEWGSAAPTSGSYKAGDVVHNIAPASGQPAFWLCTAAGSPGTWLAGPNVP